MIRSLTGNSRLLTGTESVGWDCAGLFFFFFRARARASRRFISSMRVPRAIIYSKPHLRYQRHLFFAKQNEAEELALGRVDDV